MNGLLIALAVAATVPTPSGADLFWVDDYADALDATKALEKPLLIVIDEPSDSKKRSPHVQIAPEKEKAELMENYVLCHVDATTEYGNRVAGCFSVKQYPFTAIIDRTGKWIIYKNAGRMDDSDWVATLDKHKKGQSRNASKAGCDVASGGYT